MTTLGELAQRLMDMYEQNFAPNDRFLDIDDFKFQVATTYSDALNAMYQVERAKNKQTDGFANIEIPAAWMMTEALVITEDKDKNRLVAKTKYPIFSFDWDNAVHTLQEVYGRSCTHCTFRKISLNERLFRNTVPPTSTVFYYLEAPQEIVFWGTKDKGTVFAQYVPAVSGLDEDCLLSDNVCGMIQEKILTKMFNAKNGNFIQKIDNQNPNVAPGQQVDPAVAKN